MSSAYCLRLVEVESLLLIFCCQTWKCFSEDGKCGGNVVRWCLL